MGKTMIESRLKALSAAIAQSYDDLSVTIKFGSASVLPSAKRAAKLLGKLRALLFPGYFSKPFSIPASASCHIGVALEEIQCELSLEVAKALPYMERYAEASQSEITDQAQRLTMTFLEQLPRIRKALEADAKAAYDGDPAAFSLDEIISSYPGFYAVSVYRLANALYKLGVPLIPRIWSERAHSKTGIDIHPGATIGRRFFIDHGTGIVIGETTIIGNHVKIYQGVTLGGISTRGGQALRGVKRHPTIEDYVTIYSGASIFGGQTVIGSRCVIGSNVFIASSVPPNTKVSVKNPELQYKDNNNLSHKSELEQDEFWTWTI
ncbi:MAG: serine O-acetyltransferase [Helicobacteraceae bacterium]|jgi:serine O-acetyltransferase|nr:serine O-acetyltransferase [Helicobacteraceae bacterium]